MDNEEKAEAIAEVLLSKGLIDGDDYQAASQEIEFILNKLEE